LKDTTGGSMMATVPQLVGEIEFSVIFANFLFFLGKLTVLKPWPASVLFGAA
jgi:hypothetical protein